MNVVFIILYFVFFFFFFFFNILYRVHNIIIIFSLMFNIIFLSLKKKIIRFCRVKTAVFCYTHTHNIIILYTRALIFIMVISYNITFTSGRRRERLYLIYTRYTFDRPCKSLEIGHDSAQKPVACAVLQNKRLGAFRAWKRFAAHGRCVS